MNQLISELVKYGIDRGLIDIEDKVFVINSLLEIFNLDSFVWSDENVRSLHYILSDMTAYAIENGIIKEDTLSNRDLFDTKVMGAITPMPSYVRNTFRKLYEESPQKATDFYYQFSKDTNYIRTDRISRDEKWQAETEYGVIDITINLSKPEKDPREIAKAASQVKSEYPKCLLCEENEGYAGTISHPARQNHRIIPLSLNNQKYYMQYSPYVYYNEHCIVFNEEHIPMKIDKNVFGKLLDFVSLFPHYTIGSNADLPIVGGSILSHDHFQGGAYTFAMAKAPFEYMFSVAGFDDVTAGIIKWPMSVIRLQSQNKKLIIELASHILDSWREYSDEEAFIFARTNEEAHNTITPIVRKKDSLYEMDLVLRNNITTEEKPWGVYHPDERLHHIKKENIGLIEVMGLAILPARLKTEMKQLEEALLYKRNIREIEGISKHADWVDEWYTKRDITSDNIKDVLYKEIANRFVEVLECAGVYKRTDKGREQFKRFLKQL